MKHTNFDNEVEQYKDDKGWYIALNILVIAISFFVIAHIIRYFIFIA